MSHNCMYHPTQAAWWQCPKCGKSMCPQCIDHRRSGFSGNESLFFCPRCNVQATQLDMSHIIVPFWRRLHKFFSYPFTSTGSIGLIFGLALVSTIVRELGFLSLAAIIPWLLMVKYAYEALRYTSYGKLAPPPITGEVLTENITIVLKQIALFFAWGVLFIIFILKMNPFFWILFGIAVLIGLPAMIIILAINESLLQALNPFYFLGMAARIGWSYLLLFLFLALLVSAPSALGYAVIQHLPEGLRVFLWLAAKNYYTLVSYHLMGYVILQYHERLNYGVDMETLLQSTYPAGLPASADGQVNRPDAMPAPASPEATLLNELSPMIQEGDLDGAIELVKTRTALEINDLELSDRYVNLLKMKNRDAELITYAPRHLDLLVKKGEKSKSMTFYKSCLEKEQYFKASATSLFKIGSWYSEKDEPKSAIQALNHLTKIHPADALIPKAYYRAAQILHEKLASPDRARKILTALITKYPDHEITGFARSYIKGI